MPVPSTQVTSLVFVHLLVYSHAFSTDWVVSEQIVHVYILDYVATQIEICTKWHGHIASLKHYTLRPEHNYYALVQACNAQQLKILVSYAHLILIRTYIQFLNLSIIGYRNTQPINNGAKTVHIQKDTFICTNSSTKKKTCYLRKVIAIVNQYKNML